MADGDGECHSFVVSATGRYWPRIRQWPQHTLVCEARRARYERRARRWLVSEGGEPIERFRSTERGLSVDSEGRGRRTRRGFQVRGGNGRIRERKVRLRPGRRR